MSYWFAYGVFDKQIDLKPGAAVLEGPFQSYDDAKSKKLRCRGSDLQKTSIFPAASKEDAERQIANETWIA